jgi:protein subunit release factor B
MAKEIQSSGQYTVKETGKPQSYSFEYRQFENIDDALETLGEAKVLSLVQRMEKVDANNTAREKAKIANGHSTRQPMSEEEKAEKKAERAANKQLLDALKANPELLAQLQSA